MSIARKLLIILREESLPIKNSANDWKIHEPKSYSLSLLRAKESNQTIICGTKRSFRAKMSPKLTTQTRKRASCKPFTFIIFLAIEEKLRRRKNIFFVCCARHTDFHSAHEATQSRIENTFSILRNNNEVSRSALVQKIFFLLLVERRISASADGRKISSRKKILWIKWRTSYLRWRQLNSYQTRPTHFELLLNRKLRKINWKHTSWLESRVEKFFKD